MDFFGRLREERSRLGLTQQEVADAANVHAKTVRRWETKVPVPMDAMVPLLDIGYDVQYVVSGVRSKNLADVRDKGPGYAVEPGMTRDEVDLLRIYRSLAQAQRNQSRAMLQVLAAKPAAERTPRAARGAGKTDKAVKVDKVEKAEKAGKAMKAPKAAKSGADTAAPKPRARRVKTM